MSKNELTTSDKKMVDRWHMHTEFMLNKVDVATLKRLVTDIADGVNYKVNSEGNIVEADYSPIERDKSDLNEKIHRKVKNSTKAEDAVREKISELKNKRDLVGKMSSTDEIKVLKEVLEEIRNE